MKQRVFEILDYCIKMGMDNSVMGFCQDVDTCNYFGADKSECKFLNGHWLYIYEPWRWNLKWGADEMVMLDDDDYIFLYKLD